MEDLLDGGCFLCRVCKASTRSIKRCVICRRVYYCSRECQIEDWPSHRSSCQLPLLHTTSTDKVTSVTTSETTDTDCCLLELEHDLSHTSTTCKLKAHRPETLTTSSASSKHSAECNASDDEGDVTNTCTDKEHGACIKKVLTETGKSKAINLIKSAKYLDVHCPVSGIQNKEQAVSPRSSSSSSTVSLTNTDASDCFHITVRCGSDSLVIPLQHSLSSEDMLREISSAVKIRPEKLRLISSGKRITTENLLWAVSRTKPVFLAIGEKAENEDGLEAGDIGVIMEQLKVERNVAVRALRQTSDLVDAILLIGNK